jgi:hypothetical protein
VGAGRPIGGVDVGGGALEEVGDGERTGRLLVAAGRGFVLTCGVGCVVAAAVGYLGVHARLLTRHR